MEKTNCDLPQEKILKLQHPLRKEIRRKEDWLGVGEAEEKTLYPVENGEKLEFTIDKIEQPYTIACNAFAPETLNIKFYTFVNYERYNVENKEVPIIKDTTTKPGTVYYYISNDVLKRKFKKISLRWRYPERKQRAFLLLQKRLRHDP